MYSPIDTFALTKAVYEELKSILLSYSSVMPASLIEIGKAALSTSGKVMSTPFEGDPAHVRAPRWPLAVALSYQAASQPKDRDNWTSAVPAVAAVEIAMAAADLLDELTDHDPSPVIERYGPGQALNAGNLMLVMAQQSLLRDALKNRGDQALSALDALQNMLVEAAVGQHLDMLYERMGSAEVTVEMSNAMTQMKAGALISGACRIGALTAGAPAQVVELLARFGREIGGIAQLENDLRDVLPLSALVGATPNQQKTDLLLRKRTLPIAFTLRDDSEEPNALQQAYSSTEDMGDIDEEHLREAVLAVGGIQFGELVLSVHRENALEALAELEELRPGATAILSPLLPKAPEAPPGV
ncbi:MAG: polyprenyl synthetase family protein [Chloroflexia bacterium]